MTDIRWQIRAIADELDAKSREASLAWADFITARDQHRAAGTDLSKNAAAAASLQALADAHDALRDECEALNAKRSNLIAGRGPSSKNLVPAFVSKAATALTESKAAGGAGGVQLSALDVFGRSDSRYLSLHLPNVDAADFVQEFIRVGSPTYNAAPVAESALKPVSLPTVSRERSEFSTIAHVGSVPNQMIFDHASAEEVVNELMIEGLMLAVDDQIINGDGTGENLLGLLNTPGIGTITQAAAESPIDVLLRAATTVRLARGVASLIVLSPTRWNEVCIVKDSTGNYLAGGPVDATALRIWGHSVVVSEAIADGTALVLDPARASMANKSAIDLEWNQYAGEAFRRNEFSYRCEWRGTLQVTRPSHVCEVVFD